MHRMVCASSVVLLLLLCAACDHALPTSRTKVAVVGAGRSAGFELVKKLLRKRQFEVIAVVRSERGADQLRSIGLTSEQIRVADVADKRAVRDALQGADKVVYCVSSTARKSLSSRLKQLGSWLIRRDYTPKSKDLFYRAEESPYALDYVGQKNCVDAAVEIQCSHFVLLSCMGNYRQSELNAIGRSEGDDEKVGNLLRWRRAAERYLMKRVFFTIIHAGVLNEDKGGAKEIVWDTDDALIARGLNKISKEDVAEVLMQALLWKEAIGRSIDVCSKPPSDKQAAGPSKDWIRFWSMPGDCTYPSK